MYDVNYFIKKFEAIPEEMWTVGTFSDGGKKCALGHCFTEENEVTRSLLGLLKYSTAEINDGEDERYRQPTPKQRILAALNDVKHDRF